MRATNCERCRKPLSKNAGKRTPYCAECVLVAKNCDSCGKGIAAFNRGGLCAYCRRPPKDK